MPPLQPNQPSDGFTHIRCVDIEKVEQDAASAGKWYVAVVFLATLVIVKVPKTGCVWTCVLFRIMGMCVHVCVCVCIFVHVCYQHSHPSLSSPPQMAAWSHTSVSAICLLPILSAVLNTAVSQHEEAQSGQASLSLSLFPLLCLSLSPSLSLPLPLVLYTAFPVPCPWSRANHRHSTRLSNSIVQIRLLKAAMTGVSGRETAASHTHTHFLCSFDSWDWTGRLELF